MTFARAALLTGTAAVSVACAGQGAAGRVAMDSPERAAQELLETDRRFGRAAARDGLAALAVMFDEDVILPTPGGFVRGRPAAIEALRQNTQDAASRLAWSPIRVGISADGRHGFTFGHMTQRVGDSTHAVKYLAYWVRRPDGWRVAAYRRRRAAGPPQHDAMMLPSLAPATVPPVSDTAIAEAHRRSLAAAERAFSDTAQRIGLGAAFELFGRADAINMGGPNTTDFVVGSAAIGRAVGAGTPATSSPVSWQADHDVLVASSGDLGVTFGFIRRNTASGAPAPGGAPFFTIWRREPGGPWRYIAE